MSESGENDPISSLIPGTIMLESGQQVTIDIDATVSCKSSSNTLEICLNREKEVLLAYMPDESVGTVGSNIASPFPNPHILLNDIVSFDPHNIHSLLRATLQDPILCDHLSVKIASEAKRVSVPGPLYISLHVTVTPHRLEGGKCDPERVEETCAICLKKLCWTEQVYTYLQGCNHEFHANCINKWLYLYDNNTCPLCRTVVEDSDDD